jgi:citrate lyase beta subunit
VEHAAEKYQLVRRLLETTGLTVDRVAEQSGFGSDAKVAIHPAQVAVIRDAYAPTADQVKWARSVLETARGERGVFQYEGIMVDAPVLRRAERIVQLAPHPGA